MLWEKDFFVIDITTHAIAPVNDTAEFVRNADMVVDLMQGTKIGESISKTFKKVNNFVSNFASKSSTKQETTRAQVASVSPTSGIVASGGTGSGSGAGGGTGGGSGAENTGIVKDGGAQTGADTGTSGEGEGSDEEEEPPSGSGGIVVAGTDDSDYTSIAPINGQEWCDYYKEIYGEDAVTWETDPSVVLTDQERQEIIDKGRGNRPDPTTYLPADYIENHLASFHDGASKFILYSKFYNDDGSRTYETAGAEGTGSYFLPTWYADYLMETTAGDPKKIAKALNIDVPEEGKLVLVRFDVDDPSEYDLRMPSGNEMGANEEWGPGGYTKNGTPEAILTSPRYDDGEITIIGK